MEETNLHTHIQTRMDFAALEIASDSRIGPVRPNNQDAFQVICDLPGRATMLLIADGMGGYEYGDVASQLAIHTLRTAILQSSQKIDQSFRLGFESSNLSVMQKAVELRSGPIGTTLSAAYLKGGSLILAHVGDSRIYLIRNGKVTCLTRDHTVVGELVRMRVLGEDAVRNHAQRSILTRAIGLNPVISADISRTTIRSGDSLLLCTDGLWSVISDHEIELACAFCEKPENWVASLLDLAVERMTDDNLTAIGVYIHHLPAEAESNRNTGWTWLKAFSR